jgi:hypothetical protein
MKRAAAFLVLLAAPAWGQCEASRQKQADFKKDADAWWTRHRRDCTLCADGSACREGFERRDGGKKPFEAWRAGHAQTCAACGGLSCTIPDQTWIQSLADVKARHRERCRACEFDAIQCDAWRVALDDAKLRHAAWKRDHPATCDRCAPACDEWRRRAGDAARRAEEAVQKHKERCMDCRAGKVGCDRTAVLRQDGVKERIALWKAHETCPCLRTKQR